MSKLTLIIICLVSALAGSLIDFLANGLFKIMWMVLYVPMYLALGQGIIEVLHRSRWREFWRPAVIFFLGSAFLTHYLCTNRTEHKSYSLTLSSKAPWTLSSNQTPQTLVVSGPKVEAALSSHALNDFIPIEVTLTKDYGCLRHFDITLVAGSDMSSDFNESWVWKSPRNSPANLIGLELETLPWCHFKFYQSY